MDTDVDWRVVFESLSPAACNEHALVLAARAIPHRVVHDRAGFALIVPAGQSIDAMRELRLYADENPPAAAPPPRPIEWHGPQPGILAYAAVLLAVAWLAGAGAFGVDWFAAGRIDGNLIRDGEWWRTITALTLHANAPHLVGNLVFGGLFGLFAGRLLGPGVAWLAILACAAAANAINTYALASTHRAVGASTAVFAALGITAGYVWHARLMSQERWAYRLGPIVGAVALLAFTGLGGGAPDSNVDIGAHLFGFLCGFAGGAAFVHAMAALRGVRAQLACGAMALAAVAIAWQRALH